MKTQEFYEKITSDIIAKMDSATGKDWLEPFNRSVGKGRPKNAHTQKHYRGVNSFMLAMTGYDCGYSTNVWATYKQFEELKLQVRKGEKGSRIIFFKILEKENDKKQIEEFPMMSVSTVFNLDQVDGDKSEFITQSIPVQKTEFEVNQTCQSILNLAQLKRVNGRAAYNFVNDYVTLPEESEFISKEAFHAVALHEMTHWTGHESRLKRDIKNQFGSSKYAFEELVAEMGSAFLCAEIGVNYQAQHAEYLKHWITILQGDSKAFMKAASLAQKASDYLLKNVNTQSLERTG